MRRADDRTSPAWRPRVLLAVGLLMAVLVALAGDASAQTGATASISASQVGPGQVVTVTASGLLPGGTAYIDYIPDGVRLATVNAEVDGTFVRDVRIPETSPDGGKQIVVTALDAVGNYAYLPSDLVVRGPPASAQLSDTDFTPGKSVGVSGARFYGGTPVYVVLYPEQVILATITADPDGSFTSSIRIPDDVLNGQHGIAVVGRAESGDLGYIQIYANVTGGIGDLPGGLFADPFSGATAGTLPPATIATSTTTSTSTTTTTRPAARTREPAAGTDPVPVILVLLLLAGLALGALALYWLRTPEGRQWRRGRRNARHQRRERRRS